EQGKKKSGGKLICLELDLADMESIKKFVEEFER
nr:hypothetical protein [Tanacetum cinerariifolium]